MTPCCLTGWPVSFFVTSWHSYSQLDIRQGYSILKRKKIFFVYLHLKIFLDSYFISYFESPTFPISRSSATWLFPSQIDVSLRVSWPLCPARGAQRPSLIDLTISLIVVSKLAFLNIWINKAYSWKFTVSEQQTLWKIQSKPFFLNPRNTFISYFAPQVRQ